MTDEVFALAAAQNLPVWLPSANVMRGYLRVARGDTEALAFVRQGIAAKNAQGSVLNQPFFLSLLAESCERAVKAEEALRLLAEAFAIAETTGERWFEAELYRLRGDWLLVHCSGMEAEAETCFQRALALARQQAALTWGAARGRQSRAFLEWQGTTTGGWRLAVAAVRCLCPKPAHPRFRGGQGAAH